MYEIEDTGGKLMTGGHLMANAKNLPCQSICGSFFDEQTALAITLKNAE